MTPNILFLDIETSPNLAYVWRMWKENISPKQLLDASSILSYAAVWNDETLVHYHDVRDGLEEEILLDEIIDMLDKADFVVGHNASFFDIPVINARAILAGLAPPSPYKVIDTCTVMKRNFKFPHNSLEYASTVFDLKHKKDGHKKFPGFELWKECLNGNEDAWNEMEEYNIYDTLAVRDLYYVLRPWIPNHPNVAVHVESDQELCPSCGSNHLHRRGYAYTNTGKYQRFQCQECWGWSRTRFTEYLKEVRKQLLVKAV